MQNKLTKIFVLSSLLINELDDINSNELAKNLYNKGNDFKKELEPILSKFYENEQVKKSILFLELENKIEYIFNKTLK